MNAKVRMMADVRALFWPWCIVAAAGAQSLFSLPHLPGGLDWEVVAGFGFCVGLPLLATLSFGNEFEFGTFSSLLSQPIERSRIWREKFAVIVVAVLSAAIAYGFGANRMGWGNRNIAVAALWLMVTVGSSAYWTLVAKSTIGGAVFNWAQSIALVILFIPLLNRVGFQPEFLPAIAGLATVYTAVMIYLGRRRLLRFQVTGAGPGSNVLATDWAVTPNPLRRVLRSTASGKALNLVRKELHLLWPLAPLTLIAFGMLLFTMPLRFIPGYESWILPSGISVTFMHGALAAILAGTLSLGEERTLGLHGWNMTQPVSVRLQWAIKLAMAVLASTACSAAVLLMAKLVVGPDFLKQFAWDFDGNRILAIFPLLTFFAFWCACGVNGTVRAAFWCLPAATAILVAYNFGMSTGMNRSVVEVVRTLTEAVHPFPFSSEFEVLSSKLTWSQPLWVSLWLLPFAATQSYRLFRSEIRESIKPLVRHAFILAAIGFLFGLLQIVPAAANGTMHNNTVRALMEVSRGVDAMSIDPNKVSSDGGYNVSLETISNSVALSDRTRSWFATDTVVIRPKGAVAKDVMRSGPDRLFPIFPSGYSPMKEARFMITAQLHGGWKCVFADNLFDDRYGVGAMGVPRGANYLFVCTSEKGKLGWLEAIP